VGNPRAWSVSVRELAEFVWREGDIGSPSAQYRGPTLHQGSSGHRFVQRSRDRHYQSEVFLRESVVAQKIELEVSGRADGIFSNASPVIVEEIKTTNEPLIFIDGENNRVHWAQAKIYGALYLQKSAEEFLEIQLTYFNLTTQELRSFKRRFPREELRSFFETTVTCYIDWLSRVIVWQSKRDASLSELAFPYPSYRTGQEELANKVDHALKSDTPLLVDAPTGSGKTMAVLYGALKTFARGGLNQIVYLTAKTVGRLSAEQAVDHVCRSGARLKCLSLVSREGICPDNATGCRRGECPRAKGHFDRLPEARISLFERESPSRATVLAVASDFRVCPHSLQMELVKWVDIIIGDYNYYFDPKARIVPFVSGASSANQGVLIDEAHNLVERAREMYSAAIDTKQFAAIVRKLGPNSARNRSQFSRLKTGHRSHPSYKSLQTLCRKIDETMRSLWAEQVAFSDSGSVLEKIPDGLFALIERFRDVLEGAFDSISAPKTLAEGWTLNFEIIAFLQAVKKPFSSNILYLQNKNRHFILKSFCVDPSKHLAETMKKYRSQTIFFSGTLTPLDYFATVLTSRDQKRTLKIASPFPAENCQTFFVRGISTRFPKRAQSARPIANTIRKVALAHQGNYLAFFPSYEYMNLTSRLFAEDNREVELVVQQPGMTESEKATFLAHFSANRPTSLVGFAVLGGLFGEGIDLVGERLHGAILVSPGLPKISPERELVRQYFQQENHRGFEYAYLYPGMNKVLQAAGRVIRSARDRGILVFIGDRFLTDVYRSLLPQEWQSGEITSDVNHLSQSIAEFWT